ncbi:MAG: response regulator transcription factor [Chloroflexi bacterium]|nr:response regulator transcription factor [Chloroflexota bacterium]
MAAIPKPCILVVDDDPAIRRFIRARLEAANYQVMVAADGADAVQKMDSEHLDLIILDIVMPGIDGVEVCRRIRQWSAIPIIMLSGCTDQDSITQCLDIGADDYVTKPFGVEELIARVKAILRRSSAAGPTPLQASFVCGEMEVNFAERRVSLSGQEVRLTPTEYNLLRELVLNADKVVSHGTLLKKVWGPEYGEEKQYLHVFIGRLRKSLERDSESPEHIITVPGVGYRFKTIAQQQGNLL